MINKKNNKKYNKIYVLQQMFVVEHDQRTLPSIYKQQAMSTLIPRYKQSYFKKKKLIIMNYKISIKN